MVSTIRRSGATRRSPASAWAFLSPWVVAFGLFGLFPFVFSLAASFTDYSPIRAGGARFVGLGNYTRALADPAFWSALGNTAFFVVGTIPFTTVLALALALAVQPAFRGRTLFRVGFFVPSVVSIIVLSLVFKGLYASNGALDGLLRAFGLTPPAWLLCCASSAAAAPNAYSKVAQRTSARNREDGFRIRLGIWHAPWLLELLWL